MKSLYLNELKKYVKRKVLNHLKKPTVRKRKLVDRYAFAIAARSLKHGVRADALKSVMDSIQSEVKTKLAAQGH